MINLKLRINNPYALGVAYQYPEGPPSLEREVLDIPASYEEGSYTVKDEDDLTLIAYEKYRDSKYWWVIADANQIINPFDLTTGSILRIPPLDLVQNLR